MQTSWIWQDEASGGVLGAQLDPDTRTFYWFDQPGCACEDTPYRQSAADFLARGARFFDPPADVLASMAQSAKALG